MHAIDNISAHKLEHIGVLYGQASCMKVRWSILERYIQHMARYSDS